MTELSHSSALGALDSFFSVVRSQAERDPEFASMLVRALNVPILFEVPNAEAAEDVVPYVDPVVVAGKGLDQFRLTFAPFRDAQIKRLMKQHNLASDELIRPARGAALKELFWQTADDKRRRLLR